MDIKRSIEKMENIGPVKVIVSGHSMSKQIKDKINDKINEK